MPNKNFTNSLALITILPLLVSAIPNAPAPTPAQHLDKRDNGANTIGFSLAGTTWRTRSCNTGYFSTSGTLGNCCVDNSCNFLTACSGSTIFYANGNTATCSSSTCGTGSIFKTPGDQSPLTFFNCQSGWTVTETPSPTSTGDSTTTTPTTPSTSSTSTTSTSETDSSGAIPPPSTSAVSSGATPGAGSTTRAVTLTVTNSDGTVQTTTSVQAIPIASGTPNPQDLTQETKNGGSGSNAGAIAGGVVGGVAVLAIVAGVIGFLMWKRKKAAKEAAAGTTTPLNPDAAGPSSGPPMEQQQYQPYTAGPAGYGQQGGYAPQQDYKVAPGGYADVPGGAQQLDGTPVAPNRPSELYGGPVQGPIELPAQSEHGR